MSGYAKNAQNAATPADEDEWGEDEEKEIEKIPLEIEISPDSDVTEGSECNVMVRIKIPEAPDAPATTAAAAGGMPPTLTRTGSGRADRAAMDICCVVDISGSMASKATYEVDGVQKDDGLTYLDIVKHSVRAVCKMLRPSDRFTVIAFDNKADVVVPLSYMTDEGKANTIEQLEGLRPRGGTNIWVGIEAGCEQLRASATDAGWRQKAILLLTDGQPGQRPPEGEVKALAGYKESHPDFSFQLNTFGFGYNLDSELLVNLAVEGTGTFAFIPDALIVGTTFVNSVCNSLSTHTQNATLHLMPQGGAQLSAPVIGVDEGLVTEAQWGRVVNLGPLQFGQHREIVVPMKVPAGDTSYLQAVVVFPGKDGKERRSEGIGQSRAGTDAARVATCRGKTVDTGYKVVSICSDRGKKEREAEAHAAMEELKKEFAACGEFYDYASGCGWSHAGSAENFTTMQADVDGRMTKAIDGLDRFNRWGKHYLRALTRAHQLQLCTNFMDTGLQVYGGELFKALRTEGDEVFVSLPPPEPSAKAQPPAARSASAPVAQSSSPDMNTYYGGSGGG